MTLILRLISAAFGLLLLAAQAVGQDTRVAAAADADVIATYSPYVEKRLLRAHFDRAAAKVSLVPFGPSGVENFAVAPNGAFVVYSTIQQLIGGDPITYLSLLDETGRALGEPLRSPVGAITALAVSPKGDRIAVGSDRGWMALLAVEGTGSARRLALRTTFGITADRQFTFAFRPDGSLMTIVDDWVATYRSNDGAPQRTLDLKTLDRELLPADQDIGGLFQLYWSPRGDRFLVSWGPGPMVTSLFDSAGHRLKPPQAENGFDFGASKVEFVDGGDAMILYGMQAPVLVRLKSLASTAFGGPDVSMDWCARLAGGREVAVLADDQIALWSLDGKRLTSPVVDGPDNTLRSWSRDGAEAGSITLKAGEQTPDRRLSGLAVSTNGDAIAVAEEGSAVWLAYPTDKNVVRVALSARSVAPLPDGTGFVVGLTDGTVARLSRDGTLSKLPFKASEIDAVSRIVVAPDGQSFVVVEDDERHARQLAWDGKVLLGPYRANHAEMISGAFFHEGSPWLILRDVGSMADVTYAVVKLGPPNERQVKSLDPRR